jgi:hypothetical protein
MVNKNLIRKIDEKINELDDEINRFDNHILNIWEGIIVEYQENYVNGAYILSNLDYINFYKFMSSQSIGLKIMKKTLNNLIEEKNKLVYFLEKQNENIDIDIWQNTEDYYEDKDDISTTDLFPGHSDLYICD